MSSVLFHVTRSGFIHGVLSVIWCCLATLRTLSRTKCPFSSQGVLQVEALAQLGGILMLEGADDAAKGNFFFGGVEKCRFRKPVVPGDTLVSRVSILLLCWFVRQ